MAALQIMIDELEAKASVLDEELGVLDAELQELSARGRVLSEQADQLRERKNHISFAASNLRAVLEIENPPPAETTTDPWGDAGWP